MPTRMTTYSAIVGVAAVAASVSVLVNHKIVYWPPVIALVVLTMATENFAFSLPLAGSVSLSFSMMFAALLHSGPVAALLCALAGSMTWSELRGGRHPVFLLFNAAQLTLSASLAGQAYFGLSRLAAAELPTESLGALAAAVAAAVVFNLTNMVLVSVAASILTGRSLSEVFQGQGFASDVASLLVMMLLGLIIAELLQVRSWLGLLLLVLPFMAARRTFRVYAELNDAYTSTVRSLVTAIEAKDPYTRGHSERVAIHARQLAESLGCSNGELDLVERAALLHDLGKIGIDLDTLSSSTQLSSEEVRAVRRHPQVGSDLVGSVEFLAEIVPVIRHHHERVDGAGYPDGLRGDQIPRLARVLAVADSFDAMTSDRAYRPRMSTDEAFRELERVAGTQLDPTIVACARECICVGPSEGP